MCVKRWLSVTSISWRSHVRDVVLDEEEVRFGVTSRVRLFRSPLASRYPSCSRTANPREAGVSGIGCLVRYLQIGASHADHQFHARRARGDESPRVAHDFVRVDAPGDAGGENVDAAVAARSAGSDFNAFRVTRKFRSIHALNGSNAI